MIKFQNIEQSDVTRDPFEFFMTEEVLDAQTLKEIGADFPDIKKPGIYPLESLDYGPAFTRLIEEIRSCQLASIMGKKFGVDLSGLPMMITVRGRAQQKDGRIHVDTKDKVITCLLYLNEDWDDTIDGGRLRMLRGPDDIDDYAAEIPPMGGTLAAFKVTDHSWHGHEPFVGKRRYVMFNWVASEKVLERQLNRHRRSAMLKRILPFFYKGTKGAAKGDAKGQVVAAVDGGVASVQDGQGAAPAGTVQSSLPPVAQSFLACLENADLQKQPYNHWLLTNPLPEGYADEIANLPFPPPQDIEFNGRRETNNSTRVYFTKENQEKFDVCREVVEGFNHPQVRPAIERVTGADLSDGHLRIEYCQDTEGFWLEPHTDILVKKFTMLVYLLDDPNLKVAGTDIHEGPPDFKYVHSAPYGKNLGVIFIPHEHSWHGVGKRPFKGVRKSIIINFVTSEWRDKWELA